MKNESIKSVRGFCLTFGAVVAVSLFSQYSEASGFEPVIREKQPEVVPLGFNPSSGFQLRIDGAPGVYGVEISDDLQQWSLLENAVVDEGPVTVLDGDAVGLKRRFYRATGVFEESEYHFLDFHWGVETEPGQGRFVAGYRSVDRMVFQNAGSNKSLLRFRNGFGASTRLTPPSQIETGAFLLDGTAEAFAEYTAAGLDINYPATSGEHAYADAIEREARNLELVAMRGNRDTLAGMGGGGYTLDETIQGREIRLGVMGRRSRNASLDALEGDWGFIRFLIDPSNGVFNAGAFAGGIDAQAGRFDGTYAREAEIQLALDGTWGGGNLAFVDEPETFSIPVEVEPDGTFRLSPEGDVFDGFVTRTGNLFTTARVAPEVSLSGSGHASDVVGEANYQYMIGIRRDPNPELSGRSYRILGQMLLLEDGRYEVGAFRDAGNRFAFDEQGVSTETITFQTVGTDLAGNAVQSNESIRLEVEVSIDANGMIRMDGGRLDKDISFNVFGFAQEGGDVLVLALGFMADDGSSGGVGVLLAKEIVE